MNPPLFHRPPAAQFLPPHMYPPPINGLPGDLPPLFFQPQPHLNPTLFSTKHNSSIQIRRVGKHNFYQEISNIHSIIQNTQFHIISMDTEYPGVLYTSSDIAYRNPEGQYSLMKANVDELQLIQVGLTLSDSQGNLATLPGISNLIVVWEFAISDFDLYTKRYNQKSIEMLASRGLDFDFHRTHGMNSYEFAKGLIISNLVVSSKSIYWVTFQGAYDFGYLIKALTGKNLPNTLAEFKTLVEFYFGNNVYDIKHMAKFNRSLFGGLENLAKRIGVSRILGEGHQAGSDSLLTQMVFQKIKDDKYLTDEEMSKEHIRGMIQPLTPYF